MPRGRVKWVWNAVLYAIGMDKSLGDYCVTITLQVADDVDRGNGRLVKLTMTPDEADEFADNVKLKALHTRQYRGEFDPK